MSSYDSETEAKLDQWVEFKRARNFQEADAIRDELRAQGIEPNDARPDRKTQQMQARSAPPPTYDDETEAQLDQWVELKRAKSFSEADALRDDLRSRGIDPDVARPDRKTQQMQGRRGPSRTYDPDTEAKLDRWIVLKRARKFEEADALREELRSQGVNPADARPDPRDAGKGGGGGGGSSDGGGDMNKQMMGMMGMMSNMMSKMMDMQNWSGGGGGGKGGGKANGGWGSSGRDNGGWGGDGGKGGGGKGWGGGNSWSPY